MTRRIGLLLMAACIPAGIVAAQNLRFADRTDSSRLTVTGLGRGLAVTDYDGDGDDDVFVAMQYGPSRLFSNDGTGVFTDVTSAAGLTVNGRYTSPVWADFDNDGHRDLFVGGYDSPNRLFRNRGDGTFEAVGESSGLDTALDAGSVAVADYDGDGYVDLFVAVDRAADRLYRNRGVAAPFTFVDVSSDAAVAGVPFSVAMQASWADYDHDGDPDLFVVHDGVGRRPDGSVNTMAANRFYRNAGYLPLLDQAESVGVRDPGAGNAMGIAWGDFDGDGWEDAYVSRKDFAGLYRNRGDGTFEVVPGSAGAERNGMAWGTVFGDFDNDGDADLYVANAYGYYHMASMLYENRGGTFTDVSAGSGADMQHEAIGLASGDFDADGVLDLVFSAYDGSVHLLKGAHPTVGNHLRIRLTGTQVNRMAIGSRVEVRAGSRVWSQSVTAGDSYCSQSSAVLHFGLGALTRVDEVRVYWGGNYLDVLRDVEAGQTIDLVQSGSVSTAVEPSAAASGLERLGEPFPNPAFGRVTVPFRLADPGTALVELIDITGRVVARSAVSGPTPDDGRALSIETAWLAPGVYLVRLVAGRTGATRTLVVRR